MKAFFMLQHLLRAFRAIQCCLYIQGEVQHINSLKYGVKIICRSFRIQQILPYVEALNIYFDLHFYTKAYKKEILLASVLSNLMHQGREWLQHLQITIYEANVDIKEYLWTLFS